jgi:hypothetical protein
MRTPYGDSRAPLQVPLERLPTWETLRLQGVMGEAIEGSDTLSFTEALSAMVPHQRDRWTELAGLAGSLGEVISVACAAEVEAQPWARWWRCQCRAVREFRTLAFCTI